MPSNVENPSTVAINVFDGVQLTSRDDGSTKTHWSSEKTWPLGRSMRAIRAYTEVIEIDVSTDVEIVGAWSLDGVTWEAFQSSISSSTIQTPGLYKDEYSTSSDFGPFVRYGVQVKENILFSLVSVTIALTVVLELSSE